MRKCFTIRKALGLIALAALQFLLAAGCGAILKQPFPAKSYFAIEPGPPDAAVAATTPTAGDPGAQPMVTATTRSTSGGVMLVRSVRVSPPYDGLAFVYRDGPARYESDYYVNWIAQPAALLTGGLGEWLDQAGPLPIVTNGGSVRPELILDGEVTQLLIDRTDPARPRAILAARFFLTRDVRSGPGTEILSDTSYTAQVPVSQDNAAGYAAAWGQAYRQVLQRLTVDLRSVIHPG